MHWIWRYRLKASSNQFSTTFAASATASERPTRRERWTNKGTLIAFGHRSGNKKLTTGAPNYSLHVGIVELLRLAIAGHFRWNCHHHNQSYEFHPKPECHPMEAAQTMSPPRSRPHAPSTPQTL